MAVLGDHRVHDADLAVRTHEVEVDAVALVALDHATVHDNTVAVDGFGAHARPRALHEHAEVVFGEQRGADHHRVREEVVLVAVHIDALGQVVRNLAAVECHLEVVGRSLALPEVVRGELGVHADAVALDVTLADLGTDHASQLDAVLEHPTDDVALDRDGLELKLVARGRAEGLAVQERDAVLALLQHIALDADLVHL